MTFLGTKHSKSQQRGVFSALQDDQPVSAPHSGMHVALQHALYIGLASPEPPSLFSYDTQVSSAVEAFVPARWLANPGIHDCCGKGSVPVFGHMT